MTNPIRNQTAFKDGATKVIALEDNQVANMNFTVLKLQMGQQYINTSPYEAAYLLMTGKINITFANNTVYAQRLGYFEEDPTLLHCSANEAISIEAISDAEILILETPNATAFTPLLFTKNNMLESDHRGKGLLDDTSYRIVRTIFDKRNRPESNLVVGEIITMQGHWSSYPPHYHAQAEIYHYRFSEPQGFAFGENGDQVLRLKHNDTYLIAEGQEHAHCTAPGYALYTLWFIRHLPNNPYLTPTFRTEHNWTREVSANQRAWKVRN